MVAVMLLDPAELQQGEPDIAELTRKAEHRLDTYDGEIGAIIGYWNFPVSTLVPILWGKYGLPSADLRSIDAGIDRLGQLFEYIMDFVDLPPEKWLYCWFEDALVTRDPIQQDIDVAQDHISGLVVDIKAPEGSWLSRLPEQDSYSYELAHIYIGADSEAELERKYDAALAALPFEFSTAEAAS